MKLTVLELVQDIASSMDSDEVNSISDSTESWQIALCLRSVYFDIQTRAGMPEHYDLISLDPSGDNTKPVLMTLPSNVAEIVWLKYNTETTTDTDIRMEIVQFLPLPEFLDRMHALRESDTDVDTFNQTVGAATVTFLYQNDKAPQYYTTYDDYTLIFDSYDNTVDTTLTAAKTLAYARTVPSFTMNDTATPDLDAELFPLLLNEAKLLAWAELKQASHAIAERNARRGWTRLQRVKHSVPFSDFDQLPNYGR